MTNPNNQKACTPAESAPASAPVMIETSCVLCGGGDDKLLFKGNAGEESFSPYAFSARRDSGLRRYDVWKCGKCGLVRSSPVLSEEAAGELYKRSMFIWGGEADFAARTYADLLERLCPGVKEAGGRVLEIGAADGGFIKELAARGFKSPVGVEPSADCVANADAETAPLLICDLFRPGLFPEGSFDIVTTFHVIDHLHDPLEMLRECRRVLRPGGKILIVCHDVEAPSAKVLGKLSPIFDIEHIFLFSEDTIGKLAEKAGFKKVASGGLANTYPLEYWLSMLPGVRRLRKLFPASLLSRPATINAGNLYMLAEKER